ncbi:hypothetical protein POJ06DRAFT_114724 [Lipomyces tetrasporus]|uniref:Uncharacterized protein n=1 Tax=Lipomyces tetrasporus TaxID=54092 RepID=A0AAD7VT25_9ASCO|nr:uncharacterized protein POJ06DRAFT_114724 [Lipomyces tetrasporus]KAJ8099685.1 hypothetical protein POJ06DRAFT_114724 [Lipomyces tetrasporus]
MKFRRHKHSSRKVKGSRRQRQHSPPVVKKKLDAKAEDSAKVGKPKKKVSRKKEEVGGNTPRAFAELMSRLNGEKFAKDAAEETGQNGEVDKKGMDSEARKKRTRLEATVAAEKKAESDAKKRDELKMQAGESFADFTRRVNEALPIVRARSGVPSKEAVRKMKKREIAEANGQAPLRVKKKKGTSAEEKEEEDNDDGEDYSDEEAEERRYMELKTKRSGSPDPWKKLSRAPPPKFGEIAAAPPVLIPPSKKLLNVPKKAGPLSQRLELEAERQQVIGKYRVMVERKQGKLRQDGAV